MTWVEICVLVYDIRLSIQIIVAANWFHILILLKLFIHSDFRGLGSHSAATLGLRAGVVTAVDGHQAASCSFNLFYIGSLDHSRAAFVTIICVHLLGSHRNI